MPRANINVDTGAGMFGQAIAQLGETFYEKGKRIQQAENALELSSMKRKYEEINLSAMEALSTTYDDESQQKILEQLEKDRGTILSKNAEVNNEFQIHVNAVSPGIKGAFAKRIVANKQKNLLADFEFNYNEMLGNGDINGAVGLVGKMHESGAITPAEALARVKNAPVDMVFAQSRKELVANPQGVINKLSSPEFTSKLSPDQLEANDKLLSIARKQSKVVSSESNKQLTDLMAGQKLTLGDVQARRNQLNDADYQTWTKIATRPPDKRGNVIKTTELKSMAIDVSRGTLSRLDAETRIRESLADPNGINDDQYAAVYADLDREVKGYQAQDIRTYSNSASQLILGKDSGVMQFDALGNMTLNLSALVGDEETFYRKMHFVDLYNESMNNFLAENPTVSKKDLWLKSQELKQTYVNASRNIGKAEIVKDGIRQPAPEELRKQNTKEAYEQGKKMGYWQ